jgi:hypothetical protein
MKHVVSLAMAQVHMMYYDWTTSGRDLVYYFETWEAQIRNHPQHRWR